MDFADIIIQYCIDRLIYIYIIRFKTICMCCKILTYSKINRLHCTRSSACILWMERYIVPIKCHNSTQDFSSFKFLSLFSVKVLNFMWASAKY